MSKQSDRPQLHAYRVQLLLVSALTRLGIGRRLFRMSLDPSNGELFFKLGVADGEQFAADLNQLTPRDHVSDRAGGPGPERGAR